MTKKTVTTLLTATLALSVLAPSAFADSAVYSSNAKVTFEATTDPTAPIDPDNPDNPAPSKPENPDGTDPNPGTAGPLSIDIASSLDFGTHKIASTDQTYTAAAQKFADGHTGSNYVQVTDNRGTDAGWNLSVKQLGQFNDGKNDLTGATMTFNNANLVASSSTTAGTPGKLSPKFTLTPGVSKSIVDAAANQGQGTWVDRFGDDKSADSSISLAVPGATTKRAAAYTSTLEWTLAERPAGSVD